MDDVSDARVKYFAKNITLSSVATILGTFDIRLADPIAASHVTLYFARYPLGDHRFDRKVSILVVRKAMMCYNALCLSVSTMNILAHATKRID
jgi:hypothetical protein